MTHLLDIDFAPLITVAALLGFIAVYFGRLRSRLRHRTSQLKTSSDLLSDHFSALRAFVEHPEAPAKMKEKLLIFSNVVSDRSSFIPLLEAVCSENRSRNSSEAKAYEKQLAQLRQKNEELSRNFETAVSSIVVAMILRYQDASDLLEARMARMIVDPRREFAFFAGALQFDRANDNHQNHLGVHALPA
jgi:hypothetical protein